MFKAAQVLRAVLVLNKHGADVPMGGLGFLTNQLSDQTAANAAAANSIVGNVKIPTKPDLPNGQLGQLGMNPPATTTDSLRQSYDSGKPKQPTPNPVYA